MEEIVSKSVFNETFSSTQKKPRGAKVYGIPLSKELGAFIEEASPKSKQQLFLNMFFAGKLAADDFFSEDIVEELE